MILPAAHAENTATAQYIVNQIGIPLSRAEGMPRPAILLTDARRHEFQTALSTLIAVFLHLRRSSHRVISSYLFNLK
jgi:hypothetical protein